MYYSSLCPISSREESRREEMAKICIRSCTEHEVVLNHGQVPGALWHLWKVRASQQKYLNRAKKWLNDEERKMFRVTQ